jgi:hypothetical protein
MIPSTKAQVLRIRAALFVPRMAMVRAAHDRFRAVARAGSCDRLGDVAAILIQGCAHEAPHPRPTARRHPCPADQQSRRTSVFRSRLESPVSIRTARQTRRR